MAACDAPIIILGGTLNGSAWGVVVGFSYEFSVERLIIPNEGSVGPDCRPIIRKDLVGVIDYLDPSTFKTPDTAGSAVVTTKDGDGDTVTRTLATMLADGFAEEMNRENPPARCRQRIVHKGSMSSNPLSFS